MKNNLVNGRLSEFARRIVAPFVVKTAILLLVVTLGIYTLMRILPELQNVESVEEFITSERAGTGYLAWLKCAIIGDFGYSDYFKGELIQSHIYLNFLTTFNLCLITLVISGITGTIVGILNAQGKTPFLNHSFSKIYKFTVSPKMAECLASARILPHDK